MFQLLAHSNLLTEIIKDHTTSKNDYKESKTSELLVRLPQKSGVGIGRGASANWQMQR